MTKIEFVYPNVSSIKQRGGLTERAILAESAGCEFVEMPADLVKNKSEVERTGLELGGFLTKSEIEILYNSSHHNELNRYILHTEPSLTRTDKNGITYKAPLKWWDNEWRTKTISMICEISSFLGSPPYAIEIHPGDQRNTFQSIKESSELFYFEYESRFNRIPLILLENRTGQFISNGDHMYNFWMFLSGWEYKEYFGYVVDIQQLFTTTKGRFKEHLFKIPNDSIKGFHIHAKHRLPSDNDSIPWELVSQKLHNISVESFIINPEVHHKQQVIPTIKFCKMNLLK